MPFYQKQGKIPKKRHIQYRDKENNLLWEELISRKGFSGIYSNVYHLSPPTAIKKVGDVLPIKLEPWNHEHRHHHIRTHNIKSKGNAISSRIHLFYNSDIIISKASASTSMEKLYRNGHYDECIFVHKGEGILKTNFGSLHLSFGDYAIIPRGVIWQLEIEQSMELLIIESKGSIQTPKKYRNDLGQLLEHSPYSERDIKTPELAKPVVNESIEVQVRLEKGLQSYDYQNHPFEALAFHLA